jgi:hypothetical protein
MTLWYICVHLVHFSGLGKKIWQPWLPPEINERWNYVSFEEEEKKNYCLNFLSLSSFL